MKGKQTLTALVILLGLAAYVFVFEKDKASPGSLAALAGIEPTQVTAVQWKGKDGPIRLVRDGKIWRAEQPLPALADPLLAASAVNDLLSKAPDRVLEKSENPPSEYGLNPPRFQMDYELSGGQHAALQFGSANPGGVDRYARSSASPQIFLVPVSPITALESRKAESALDQRVADFDPDQVESLTLTRPHEVIRIVRDGAGWQMISPWKLLADTESVSGSLGVIRNLNLIVLARFLPGAQNLREEGFQPPELRLELKLKDGRRLGVEIGSSRKEGAYARRLDENTVFILKKGDAAAISPQALNLVDRTLVPLLPRDVHSIHLHNPLGDLEAHHESNEWFLDKPLKAPLPPSLIADVGAVVKLKGVDALSVNKADWRRFGLDHPTTTLDVTASNGKSIHVVFATPAGNGAVPAARSDSPVITAVPANIVWSLAHLKVR